MDITYEPDMFLEMDYEDKFLIDDMYDEYDMYDESDESDEEEIEDIAL